MVSKEYADLQIMDNGFSTIKIHILCDVFSINWLVLNRIERRILCILAYLKVVLEI